MTRQNDPDVLIRALLEDGPTRLSDRALASTLGEVHQTRQRTVLGPWRTLPMSRTAIAAATVIAVLAFGGFALLMNRPSSGPSVGTPAASGAVVAPLVASPTIEPLSPSPSSVTTAPGTILFGRHDKATDATTLYAMAPDGSQPRQVEARDACCLVQRGNVSVYAITIGGRMEPVVRYLDGRSPVEYLSWTKDGGIDTAKLNLAPWAISSQSDIAFEGWDDSTPNRSGIYLSVANGGGSIAGPLSRVTNATGTTHDVPIGFSEDAKRLLYIRLVGDGAQSGNLYVIGVNGKGLRRLNPASTSVLVNDAFGAGATFSPDGTQVTFAAFDSTRNDGTSSVYVVGVDGGDVSQIAGPGSYMTTGRWSPDGQWIAYDQGPGDHDIHVIHPDGTGERNLTAGLATGVCCPVWSPDGAWLIAQSGEPDQGTVDLWLVPIDGSPAIQLTHQPGEYDWYSWSTASGVVP